MKLKWSKEKRTTLCQVHMWNKKKSHIVIKSFKKCDISNAKYRFERKLNNSKTFSLIDSVFLF